ncbi:MAG: cyclic nucleotide-binding domain-containing protein, partial [Gammaproteobacteria bacterium]
MYRVDTLLIRRVKLFSALTDGEIGEIINAPENGLEEYAMKDNIFIEGDPGEHMYIVLDGVVGIYVGGEYSDKHGKRDTCITSIRSGEYFGETAALTEQATKRTATARADAPTKVFKIHKKYVLNAAKYAKEVTGRYPPDEVRDTVLKLPLFKGLSRDEIHNIRDWALVVTHNAGSFIYKPGTPADSMYVILSGRVELLKLDDNGNPVVIANEGPGEYFGEMALLPKGRGKHNHFSRTITDCRLIKIPRTIFNNLLHRDATLI